MTLSVKWSERGLKDGASPIASYGWKGQHTASKVIAVRWEDRFLAQKQCVGYSVARTEGGVKRLRRELPEVLSWDERAMCCQTVRCVRGEHWTGRTALDRATGDTLPGYPKKDPNEDEDGDDKWKLNEFQRAVLQLDFGPVEFPVLPDAEIDGTHAGSELARFVSRREDRCASYITVRGGRLFYIVPGLGADEEGKAARAVPFSVGKVEGKSTLFLKWHQVALEAVPWKTIDGLVGKTNKLAFLDKDPGTLLFLPPKVDRYLMPNMRIGCDVEFVLDHFAPGQLKILRAAQGEFIDYRFVTADPTIIEEPDLKNLPAKKFLYDAADLHDAFVPDKG